MQKDLRDFLKILISGGDLTETEAADFFGCLQAETENENLLAATLTALEAKGVSVGEIYAMAKIMRERCIKVFSTKKNFVDLVGTGGSCVKTFNVSTTAAFVIAGANVAVAKHGNRAATSNSGSADVLDELGVNVAAEAKIPEKCLEEIGICFLFAPSFHKLSPTLAKVRREIKIPTVFNVLGPICNPASAPHQVIGVWNRDLVEKIAHVLAGFETKKTWVVHGADGLDEITLNGQTFVAEVNDGKVKSFEISPTDFGLTNYTNLNLRKFTSSESAEFIKKILSNDLENEAAKNLVLINAAAAIYVSENALNLSEAFQMAKKSLESGNALKKLHQLVKLTNS